MIEISKVVMPSKEQTKACIRGMRNPKNSWILSDTNGDLEDVGLLDAKLMRTLAKAGTDHRKFMRMLTVILDINAPLYWWKEFDTYKVGTVANSCSTMHKITQRDLLISDFSHEHMDTDSFMLLEKIIANLNECINNYENGSVAEYDGKIVPVDDVHDKKWWWQIIQLLPSSFNQKRTVMLNYEVLANMYKSRKNHKLDEWRDFCKWIETLPMSELIIGEQEKPSGKFECFHCLTRNVIWQNDFSFEDYGYEGEGIVQVCTCANCGAEIEYKIDLGDKNENN